MSRSKRKTPVFGHTKSDSEKQDKRLANRRLRRCVKTAITADKEDVPKLREVSDVWSMDKDGKSYWKDAKEKDMRK